MGLTRDNVYPSKYLKHTDLGGQSRVYTVHSVSVEAVGPEQVEKPICWFKETNRGLVLNVTNWDVVADLLGEDSDDWIGHQIELFPAKTTFGGKRVDCIRVQEPKKPFKEEVGDEVPY
jgi:hypothetical protein